jgi:hypothetical protein
VVFCWCWSHHASCVSNARPRQPETAEAFLVRNPAAGIANRVSLSGSVVAEGGCHKKCVSRAAYAVAQSATFELNSPKMAVRGQKLRIFNKEARPEARGPASASWGAGSAGRTGRNDQHRLLNPR